MGPSGRIGRSYPGRIQSLTAFHQPPALRAMLVLVTPADPFVENPTGVPGSYAIEPSPEALLDALLPKYVTTRIYAAMLEAAASESASRRRAMKSASDNAEELAKNLSRQANAARQAEITQEISEIVGGADALVSAGSDD